MPASAHCCKYRTEPWHHVDAFTFKAGRLTLANTEGWQAKELNLLHVRRHPIRSEGEHADALMRVKMHRSKSSGSPSNGLPLLL